MDIIFLAGGPRPSQIVSETGWPLFRIPIGPDQGLLDEWRFAIEGASSESARMRIGVWQVLLSTGQESWPALALPRISPVFEPRPHRGTAGALRDSQIHADYGAELLLIVELSASPLVELGSLLAYGDEVRASPLTCVVGESGLGRYCGVTLCHRSALQLVSDVGFCDFKEQFLPSVRAAGGEIRSVVIAERARRIRNRTEWLDAVAAWRETRAISGPRGDRSARVPREGGEWSLIHRRAGTEGARIVRSIIMDEAIVEPGAVVARSVIGPGIRVPAGARIIDSIVADPVVGRAVLQRRDAGVVFREAVG